jgi:hypothetical protein
VVIGVDGHLHHGVCQQLARIAALKYVIVFTNRSTKLPTIRADRWIQCSEHTRWTAQCRRYRKR